MKIKATPEQAEKIKAILNEPIDEHFVVEPKPGIHDRVMSGKRYWYITERGYTDSFTEMYDRGDATLHSSHNYYHPDYRDLCELDAARLRLHREMQAWSREHGGMELNWANNEQRKYYIRIMSGKSGIESMRKLRYAMMVYFTEDAIDEALKLFGPRMEELYAPDKP